MKLIDNARSAWRLWTVQLGAAMVAWGALPLDLQARMLDAVGVPANRMPLVLGVLVIIARVLAQKKAQ